MSTHPLPDQDTATLTFHLPPGWQTRTDPATGVVARARPRRHAPAGVPPSIPPEVVVRSTPVDGDLVAWRAEALRALADQLTDFELEDEDDYDLGPHHVRYHRFGHRLGTAAPISEQWAWLVEGLGVTLTCTVVREEYAGYCELFEEVASTVRLKAATRSRATAERSSARSSSCSR